MVTDKAGLCTIISEYTINNLTPLETGDYYDNSDASEFLENLKRNVSSLQVVVIWS